MRTAARLRQLTLLVTALGLLLGATAGVALRTGDLDRSRIRSSAALSTVSLVATPQADGLDSRLQRPTKAQLGGQAVRHDTVAGPGLLGLRSAKWAAALAAVIERAGHPERAGHILLRGPPGPSV
jgi:hypothetical protein